jgi:hypothetical protein
LKDAGQTFALPHAQRVGGKSNYAYALETTGYYSPRSLFKLLKHNVRVKISTANFHHESGKNFSRGTLVIPLVGQERTPEQIEYLLDDVAKNDGVDIYACNSGLDLQGASLGSNSFQVLRKPEIAMIVGDGINATDAGEIWHLLDTRFSIPVTLLPVDVFNRANLSRYNTIILPPMQGVTAISENGKEKLRTWVQNGGILIGFESALTWLNSNGIGRFETKKDEPATDKKSDLPPRPYSTIENYTDAQVTSGAIFEAHADLTHPLLYGYENPKLSVFKANNFFMEKAKNPYGNPLVLTQSPLQCGYISKINYAKAKESSVIGVTAMGQGKVIGFTSNVCFRAFWLGTNKLLTNAIFYGPLIHASSSR